MGALWVSTTRANTSTSTGAALARNSARAQASTVAPEVRTSSTSTTRRPSISVLPVGRDLERALDVAGALRPRQADLLLGRPDAPQRFGSHLYAGLPLDDARQRAGLVVTAAPAAPPVQRHRNQHIGLVEQFPPGPRHPAAHRGGEIGAVLVFQRMHQRARDVVIAHRGAGALIGRRIGDRFHRQQAGAGIVDKGNAEPRAKRRRDERQFCPAGRRRRLRRRRVRGRRRTASAARCRARAAPHAPRAAARVERAAQMGGDGTVMVMPRRPWA